MRNLSRVTILFFFFISAGTAAAEKIDINTAPLEDLVKIIHIGEIRASELISLRPFSSLDELTKIKGIGEMRLKDIKEQGLAWVAPQAQLEPQSQPEPELQSQKEEGITEVGLLQIEYPSGVMINEILPSPTGPDEAEEWIEIFNRNSFEVNLAGWQIADTIGTTKTYNFPENTKIASQGFLVLSRLETKITLNNDGDGLKLIQPAGKVVDEVTYEKAVRGQSYNRTDSGWQWSGTLTPGLANIIPTSVPKEIKSSNSEKETNSENELKKASGLAQIFREEILTKKSFLPFGAATILAVFSGVIILVLKKILKINYNEKV